MHVIFVDNGRTEVLASECREILRCIRCGACLNVCPVYRQASGHAYRSVYPGPVGAVLSIVGLVSLVYGIIEAPSHGWTSSRTIVTFAFALIVLAAFAIWELRSDHPMLDVTFFENPRFTAANISIVLVFFALFGSLFFLTQYLQFVLGYTPLQAGIRVAPIALVLMVSAPLAGRFVARFGNKVLVAAGMTAVAIGLGFLGTITVSSWSWPEVFWPLRASTPTTWRQMIVWPPCWIQISLRSFWLAASARYAGRNLPGVYDTRVTRPARGMRLTWTSIGERKMLICRHVPGGAPAGSASPATSTRPSAGEMISSGPACD
jgi:ferredoxin